MMPKLDFSILIFNFGELVRSYSSSIFDIKVEIKYKLKPKKYHKNVKKILFSAKYHFFKLNRLTKIFGELHLFIIFMRFFRNIHECMYTKNCINIKFCFDSVVTSFYKPTEEIYYRGKCTH